MEIIFERPVYLWLLFIVPILIIIHFLTLKVTTRKAIKFANFEIIERITEGQSLSKNYFLLIIRILILLLFVLALAGLTISYSGIGSDSDFALAIDASNSMLLQDLQPNRLEVAKNTAKDFVDSLSSSNLISVVSFSTVTLVENELTDVHFDLKNSINNIIAKDTGGTAIGDAIITSTNTLLQSEKPKTIILITDGRSTIGTSIDNAIEYAKLKQITIITIGIGTEEGAEFIPGVNLTLDLVSLQKISSETNGKYFRATGLESLENAYNEISNSKETSIYRNLTFPFTVIALILLLLEWVLFNTKYRTIP